MPHNETFADLERPLTCGNHLKRACLWSVDLIRASSLQTITNLSETPANVCSEPEFDVGGVITDRQTLVQIVPELMPHLVLLDICLSKLKELDSGIEIRKRNSTVKLLCVTIIPTPDAAVEASRCDAFGYLVKECSVEELLRAMRLILDANRTFLR